MDSSKELFRASLEGDELKVIAALAAGAMIDSLSQNQWTALCAASLSGHAAIVERLLAAGASVDTANKCKTTPLIIASQNGHTAVVGRLLVAGANPDMVDNYGDSSLHSAAFGNRDDVARLLMNAGVNPFIRNKKGQTATEIFEAKGNTTAATFLREYERSPAVFFCAIARGDFPLVQRLVDAVNLTCRDEQSRTPLHVAAQYGHTDIVNLLVRQGASVNAQDGQGQLPLHLAWARGDLGSVRALLEDASVSVAATPEVRSALALAYAKNARNPVHDDTTTTSSVRLLGDPSAKPYQHPSDTSTTSSVRLLGDLSAYPYHAAVYGCHGDLVQFCDASSRIASSEIDTHALMPIELSRNVTTRTMVCPAEYAYLLGYDGIGDVLTALMDDPSVVTHRTPAISVSVLGDLDAFEYAVIVQESSGDVVQFHSYLAAIDEAKHSVSAQFEVEIVANECETVSWSAIELAIRLGYRAVADYLVNKTCQHLPIRARLALIDRAVKHTAS